MTTTGYTTLTCEPVEKGTMVITVAFKDETGAAVIPTALTKTLTDSAGRVINSINGTVVAGLASTMTFVLTGDDLAVESDLYRTRHFTLRATYNSTNGIGLTLNVPIIFDVYNAIGIT